MLWRELHPQLQRWSKWLSLTCQTPSSLRHWWREVWTIGGIPLPIKWLWITVISSGTATEWLCFNPRDCRDFWRVSFMSSWNQGCESEASGNHMVTQGESLPGYCCMFLSSPKFSYLLLSSNQLPLASIIIFLFVFPFLIIVLFILFYSLPIIQSFIQKKY